MMKWVRGAGLNVVLAAGLMGAEPVKLDLDLGKVYVKHELADAAKAPVSANREYRLMLPHGFGEAGRDRRWPLVIYMHGGGSKGSDGLKPLREELPKLLATPGVYERFPCLVLVPQCREGDDVSGERPNNWVKWDNQREKPERWLHSDEAASDQLLGAMAALEDVCARYNVDQQRIYLTGVSMGGSASWNWTSRDPQRFAAVIPVCGLSDVRRAVLMPEVTVWTYHGDMDNEVPVQRTRDMVKALKGAGSTLEYTEYAGGGHGIAKRVWTEDDYASLRWLFDQRKVVDR